MNRKDLRHSRGRTGSIAKLPIPEHAWLKVIYVMCLKKLTERNTSEQKIPILLSKVDTRSPKDNESERLGDFEFL